MTDPVTPTLQDKLNALSLSELRSLCSYNRLPPGGTDSKEMLIKRLLTVKGELVWPAAAPK